MSNEEAALQQVVGFSDKDKEELRASVDRFATKLKEESDQKAALKDKDGRLKIKDTSEPLSQLRPDKVLDLDKDVSVFKAITSGEARSVDQTRKVIQQTKARYEPVIYVKGDEINFLSAIVTPDRTHEDYYENYHVAMSDIGPNAILEEVVRDKDNPETVLEVRYWRKSTSKEALDAAKQVKYGRSEFKVDSDGSITPITNPDYKLNDPTGRIESRYNDSNRLLSEPLVLEQLSKEDANAELIKPDKVLVKYDDLAEPSHSMAVLNEIRDPRVVIKKLDTQGVYQKNVTADGQTDVDSGSDTVMSDSFEHPVMETFATEADRSAGMEIQVGDVIYKKVIIGANRQSESRYQTADGREISQSEMEAEIRKHRIGEVSMDQGNLFWHIPEQNFQSLVDRGSKRRSLRESNPVYSSGPGEDALEFADRLGLTLANVEQLARENVLTVTSETESSDHFRDVPKEDWGDLAIRRVEDLIVDDAESFLARYVDDDTNKRYEVRFTPFLSSDGKRLTSIREFSPDGKTVTKRLRLVDEADVSQASQTTDMTSETNRTVIRDVLTKVNVDNPQTDAKTVLSNLDKVIGVQV